MNDFWIEIMNSLLGDILYHGQHPDEKSWYEQYKYEIANMVEDITNFHEANKYIDGGVSDNEMARFLIYAEFVHIGNKHLVSKQTIDKTQLTNIATQINCELNKNQSVLLLCHHYFCSN